MVWCVSMGGLVCFNGCFGCFNGPYETFVQEVELNRFQ